MANKFICIDFEFFDTAEKDLNLVCCSFSDSAGEFSYDYWLLDHEVNQLELVKELEYCRDNGYIFRAHNVVAEARALLSLGLDPTEFKWVDTFAEWRCLTNHNHDLQYGYHLVKGKIKNLKPPRPKWQREEGESTSGKLTHSLSEMVYKLLEVEIDTDHKTEMRNIIISGNVDLIEENRSKIMEYCRSDIQYLDKCFRSMVKKYIGLNVLRNSLLEEMLWRGETMARTAIMEREGYPIDYQATKNFSNSVDDIL